MPKPGGHRIACHDRGLRQQTPAPREVAVSTYRRMQHAIMTGAALNWSPPTVLPAGNSRVAGRVAEPRSGRR